MTLDRRGAQNRPEPRALLLCGLLAATWALCTGCGGGGSGDLSGIRTPVPLRVRADTSALGPRGPLVGRAAPRAQRTVRPRLIPAAIARLRVTVMASDLSPHQEEFLGEPEAVDVTVTPGYQRSIFLDYLAPGGELLGSGLAILDVLGAAQEVLILVQPAGGGLSVQSPRLAKTTLFTPPGRPGSTRFTVSVSNPTSERITIHGGSVRVVDSGGRDRSALFDIVDAALSVVLTQGGSLNLSGTIATGSGTPAGSYLVFPAIAGQRGSGASFIRRSGLGLPAWLDVIQSGGGTIPVFGTVSTSLVVGGAPRTVEVADIENDAFLDVAVTDFTSGLVRILRGNGLGGLSALTTLASAGVVGARFGNFLGSSLPDVASAPAVAQISVFENLGLGVFNAALDFPASTSRAVDLGVGDLNGDGLDDLVGSHDLAGEVSVLLSTGFSATTRTIPGGNPAGVALGDLDATGTPDIAVSSSGPSLNVHVIPVLPGGSLGSTQTISVSTRTARIEIASIDADTNPDIVLGHFASTEVSILLGTGGGTFTAAPRRIPVAQRPTGMRVVDINKDGFLDIVTVGLGLTQNMTILRGAAGGVFLPAVHYDLPDSPLALAVGDMNLDDKLDVVTAHSAPVGGETLKVFLQQ